MAEQKPVKIVKVTIERDMATVHFEIKGTHDRWLSYEEMIPGISSDQTHEQIIAEAAISLAGHLRAMAQNLEDKAYK